MGSGKDRNKSVSRHRKTSSMAFSREKTSLRMKPNRLAHSPAEHAAITSASSRFCRCASIRCASKQCEFENEFDGEMVEIDGESMEFDEESMEFDGEMVEIDEESLEFDEESIEFDKESKDSNEE